MLQPDQFAMHRISAPRRVSAYHAGQVKEVEPGMLRCLDLDEDKALPADLVVGKVAYDEFKPEGRKEGQE